MQRTRRTTGATMAVAGAVVTGLVVAVAVLTTGGAGAAEDASGLPGSLAGLPAQQSGPADELAGRLTDQLAAEPSVAGVAVRTYGDDEQVMVVLDLTPRSPFTEETAAELSVRLLGAAGSGGDEDARSQVSTDGLALITCRTTAPGSSTCVSVEPDRAFVVLTRGARQDPVTLTTDVRDQVSAAAAG